MGLLVCAGAILQCSFGQSPMPLMVIPQSGVTNIMPAANITDNKPIINIPSFIMCNSMANPQQRLLWAFLHLCRVCL